MVLYPASPFSQAGFAPSCFLIDTPQRPPGRTVGHFFECKLCRVFGYLLVLITYLRTIEFNTYLISTVFKFVVFSYPLLASVVVSVRDAVLAISGGCDGGGDNRRVLSTHMVISSSLGAVRFSTVLAQKHRLLIIRKLSSTALLVILVAHQTGKVGWASLYVRVFANTMLCGCVKPVTEIRQNQITQAGNWVHEGRLNEKLSLYLVNIWT